MYNDKCNYFVYNPCNRVRDGMQMNVKGALKGKGRFIKSSDNG